MKPRVLIRRYQALTGLVVGLLCFVSCVALCCMLALPAAAAETSAAAAAETNAATPSPTPAATPSPTPAITSLDELSGKIVGAPTGGTIEIRLQERVPDISDISYFATFVDMVPALKSGKIDAFIADEPVAQLLVSRNDGIAILPEPVEDDNYGLAFRKNSPLTAEFNRVIEQFEADGTLGELKQKWCGADEAAKVMPQQDWPTPAGTLVAAMDVTNEPMGYIKDGEIAGYCAELYLLCCKELGYAANMQEMSFDAEIAAMQSAR